MALLYTDNKSNASAAAIKTPFLIEDILDRNSLKAANKIHFKDNVGSARNNNGTAEHSGNSQSEKQNHRNNNEIQSNEEEYRKLLQSDRYDKFNHRKIEDNSL